MSASLNQPEDAGPMRGGTAEAHAVVLFDGVCNLCNASIQFILRRDPRGHLRFAALQSDAGRRVLAAHGKDPDRMDSVVLVDEHGVHERSDAVLRIARRMRGAWPLLVVLRLVPRPIRDWAYDRIAANRYRWFGRTQECMIPTPSIRARFLDDAEPLP